MSLLEEDASEERLFGKFLLGKGRNMCNVFLSLTVEEKAQRLYGTQEGYTFAKQTHP